MDFTTVKELENKLNLKTTKQNICFVSGEGNTLFDTNGRGYLDLTCGGGESCLGYGNPDLTNAIINQANTLTEVSNEYYCLLTGQVLSKLTDGTGFTRACLTGGAYESVKTAMEIVFNHLKEKGDGRKRVVVCGGEHNLIPDDNCSFVEFNNFEALKKALTKDTAVFIIAPVTDSDRIADYDFLVNAYVLCKSMDIVLFCDESRIGIGRTGQKFAYQSYGVQPDIVTLSRGLAGGLNAGAVLTRDNIAQGFKPLPCLTGTTNLISLAALEVVLDRLNGGVLEKIAEKGEYLLSKLYKLTKYNFVLDVRGKGLLAGIELSGRVMAAKVVSQMEKQGFLLSHSDDNVIMLSPAFSITHDEINKAIDALAELFSSTNV